jgi:hypothetical protein
LTKEDFLKRKDKTISKYIQDYQKLKNLTREKKIGKLFQKNYKDLRTIDLQFTIFIPLMNVRWKGVQACCIT